jgi:two-component system cell cycle response regulator DivK
MKVLIVEDSDDTREFMNLLLMMNGYIVVEARDGQEAVDQAIFEKPDLILMDLNLPIMTGWEATRTIKRSPSMQHIPIIAVTANAHGEWKEAVLAAGAVDCLAKPIDNKKLLDTISSYNN